MQGSLRVKSVLSAIKSFVSDNKKVIICATIIFALGITVGVISAFGAVAMTDLKESREPIWSFRPQRYFL